MEISMKHGLTAVVSAAMFALAPAAAASTQMPPPETDAQPPQMQAPAPATEVTEAQLDTFATIYVEMQSVQADLSQQVAEADSPEQAQQIQQQLESSLIEVIEENGWDVDTYNEVAEAINRDPELRMQVVTLINQQS
jgi:restriction endonuclease Mrr